MINLATLLDLNRRPILYEVSKKSLIDQGYPPSVALLFIEQFGKYAGLFARWFKEYSLFGKPPTPNWFYDLEPASLNRHSDLTIYSKLADALSTRNIDTYNNVREELGLWVDRDQIIDFDEYIPGIKKGLLKALMGQSFFGLNIMKDFREGKLTDLKPYAKLEINDANERYEEKQMFSAGTVPGELGYLLKRYPDGMMWIGAGQKCRRVGNDMKNCGSTGVMSLDAQRNMFVLYDSNRKAHAIFTLNPNEGNRISGIQGKGSTELKPEYNDYVLDAVKVLDGWIDLYGSGTTNKPLKLRYMIGDNLLEMERLQTVGTDEQYRLRIALPSGGEITVYTDGYSIVTDDALNKPEYASYLTGIASQEEMIKRLLSLSHAGRLMYNLPRVGPWLRSIGIIEPEQKQRIR